MSETLSEPMSQALRGPDAHTEAAHGFQWEEFERLQTRLAPLFRHVFADPAAPRCVVVVPGLSLDAEVLAKVSGARFYEERMLSMLMLLRFPNTKLVFVTSSPIDPAIVDYYLGLLPGVPDCAGRLPGTLQLWPHRHHTDAMFMALLRKQ